MDGGVAFGVVPKTIWKRLIEPDENNMVKITSRSFLIRLLSLLRNRFFTSCWVKVDPP